MPRKKFILGNKILPYFGVTKDPKHGLCQYITKREVETNH